MFKTKIFLSILLACVALAGCGGAADSPAPAPAPVVVGPTAEGFYSGSITGAKSSGFQLLVLENGDFWGLYGNPISAKFSISGLVQGSGTSNNGVFTSSNLKDFGVFPSVAGALNATYDATAKTITGTGITGAANASFNGGPAANSLYNYTIAASLTNIAGSWLLTTLSGATVNINIAATGTFSAVENNGCQFSGKITPRASGKNVFDTATTFGPAPCSLPGQTASGIALSQPLAAGNTQLILEQVDSTRTYSAVAFGTR